MGQPKPDALSMIQRSIRWRLAPVLIACSMVLAIMLAFRCIERYHDAFGMYHDDAIYMVTGQALANGDGYRIMSLPGRPLETKYPIGFPLLLSIAWKLAPNFPGNLWLIECAQVVTGLAFVFTACAYLKATRKVTPLMAGIIFAVSVLNFHFLDFAPMVMSDLPCALFSVLSLWLAEESSKKGYTTRGAVLLGFLLACTGLVRMLGLIPLVSVVIFLGLKRRWRLLLTSAGAALLLLVPYMVWQSTQQSSANPFLSYYTNYLGHATATMPRDILSGGFSDFQWLMHLETETAFPLLSQIPYRSLTPVIFWLIYRLGFPMLILPAMIGNVIGLRRGYLPAIYGFLLFWALLFWPAKIEWRHIVVFLPFFYYFFFFGLHWLGSLFKRIIKPRVAFSTTGRILSSVLALYLVAGCAAEALQRAGTYGDIIASHIPQLAASAQRAEYLEACRWIRQHTTASDVFVCNNDPLLYLYTKRQAISPSRYEVTRFVSSNLVEAASMSSAIQFAGANYVMSEPSYRAMGLIWAESRKTLLQLLSEHPGCLSPVFKSSHGLIYIFKVDRTKL